MRGEAGLGYPAECRNAANMCKAMRSTAPRWEFMLATLLLALCSCQHKILPQYEYPPGWVTVEYPSDSARALTGVVVDPSGATMANVLVERTTSDFTTRLDARLTDRQGRFEFGWMHAGTYY